MTKRCKPATLAARLAVSLAALTAAYFATLDTWVRVVRRGNPEAALLLRPTDARALAQIFDNKLVGNPNATVSDSIQRKARAALNDQPLNAQALRLIGLWAAVRNSMALSDRAMALSARVTRRETPVQFWLIERAVQRGDIPDAISHYHAALSVTPSTRSVLFPILIESLSEADIRTAIIPYVQRRTVWSTDLLNAAITEGDPRNVVALMLPIARTLRTEPFRFTNAMLISRLTETGNVGLARAFIAQVWPEMRADGLSHFGVTPVTTDQRLGAMGWTFGEGGVQALPNGEGGMDIDVDPLANARVARRIWPVASNRSYRFRQVIERDDTTTSAALDWAAHCQSTGKRIKVWEHRSPSSSTGQETSVIQVPASCTALEFTLTVAGPDAQTAARLRLKSLELEAI